MKKKPSYRLVIYDPASVVHYAALLNGPCESFFGVFFVYGGKSL